MSTNRPSPNMIVEYSDAVLKYGPDSPEASHVHAKYANVAGFVAYAKSIRDLVRSADSLRKTDDSIRTIEE